MNFKITLLVVWASFTCISYAQNPLWTPILKKQIASRNVQARDYKPEQFQLYRLDLAQLKSKLANSKVLHKKTNTSNTIDFPNEKGELVAYQVSETATMHPDLAAKYLDIKNYKGTDSLGNTIQFSITPFGLHTLQFINGQTIYTDPYTDDLQTYIVYNRRDVSQKRAFSCHTRDIATKENSQPKTENRKVATNPQLRTYRIAITTTTEYSNYHIRRVNAQNKSETVKKGIVLAAINVTLSRVNAIYGRDFSLQMQLVADNDQLIFIDSDTFQNDNSDQLLNNVSSVINSIIGFNNYDIGHIVSTGGGGVAFLESVCTNDKAKGVTGSPSPVGDPYDIDFVAHEIGHQFGAYHTFNNSCGGNMNQETAYEPGSGSTIMSYAGICDPNNIQSNSDAYFHAASIQQINTFINTSQDCSVRSNFNNVPPVVDAGLDYIIPYSTPFKLKGTATDTDANLTYCWEQFDKGQVSGKPNTKRTYGANFRSLSPTTNDTRYFPAYENVIDATTNDWEVLPEVDRSLNFILSVRDNNVLGGLIGQDEMRVTVLNKGPFSITSQSTENSCLVQGIDYRVSWNVAGTTSNGINTSNVNIKLSKDNGKTFDYVLASETPNDGEEKITCPEIFCDECRILIEPTNNIYYAVNKYPFAIGKNNSCLTDFVFTQDYESARPIKFEYKTITQTPVQVKIYDMTGRLVATENYPVAVYLDESISTANLQDGVYIFQLTEAGIKHTKKFMVSNNKR